MAFSIRNPEASALPRRLAEMEHTSITEAVVTALNEAITARLKKESAVETARRVLDQHGIVLTERMRKPVPQSVWDELHDDPAQSARSCDFGQVEERCGNPADSVDG